VPAPSVDVRSITGPSPRLLTLFILRSVGFLCLGPWAIGYFLPSFFKYKTLVYRFDDEGVSMSWGILWRREIHLTYARIQDIHLVSNVVERWLGLGRVQIQTASGQAGAEMTIEGLRDCDGVRDELYRRMRGARIDSHDSAALSMEPEAGIGMGDVAAALNDAVGELRALRDELARHRQ
jgi:putative membrane protein